MSQAPVHLRCPTLDSLQKCPVFLELESPELDAVLQTWSHQGRVDGRTTSLNLLATFILMHPRIDITFPLILTHSSHFPLPFKDDRKQFGNHFCQLPQHLRMHPSGGMQFVHQIYLDDL